MSYLLDSDVVIDFLEERGGAAETINPLRADSISISLMTLGEVYEGILFGRNPVIAEAGLERFLREVDVVGLDRSTMRRFAHVRGTLRRQGRIIPDPGLLIAATALEHNLTLVTRNVRRFDRVSELTVLTS